MDGHLTPRQMTKALARGETPARPLLLPIVFSLGARLENMPLSEFSVNATKIAAASRQIRSFLKTDGVTCYWDPFLEAEALGCRVERDVARTAQIACSPFGMAGDPAGNLNERGRVPVAMDVAHRLKLMLKDEPAMMMRVTGPFTLARQLAPPGGDWVDLVPIAAQAAAALSNLFVEAGADVLLLAEDWLPPLSAELCGQWAELLSPIANAIRFYEALPLLLLPEDRMEEVGTITPWASDWLVCRPPGLSDGGAVALPSNLCELDARARMEVAARVRALRPQIVTTSCDLPQGADWKPLAQLMGDLAAPGPAMRS
jgi:hypothetical protein